MSKQKISHLTINCGAEYTSRERGRYREREVEKKRQGEIDSKAYCYYQANRMKDWW